MTLTPSSTYRVQLTPDFGFDNAAVLAEYLADLGVSHLYCSPYLQAANGSRHGYDVVDHSRVNEELGGEAGRIRMVEALKKAGLGQVVDVVPNHMAIGGKANRWWWDVLENGPSSVYASYFDIDWNPPEAKLRNRVLMAILGDHYGRVLEASEIRLVRSEQGFTVAYFDHELPLAPPSLEPVLQAAARRCASPELESLASAFGRLPKATVSDDESMYERVRDKEVLGGRLQELIQGDPRIGAAIDGVLAELNADPDALDLVLERQNYRLAYWKTAVQDLDYRRFFDVDTLIGLRTEEPEVFQQTHGLILGWVADGSVDGLRIDHPDGLRDPEAYLVRLAERAPDTWVVVEKILEPGESLPGSWPVAGTTGYDFLNQVTGLFVDPAAEEPLTEAYVELTSEPSDWAQTALQRKHQVLREVLAADLSRLTGLFVAVCERHRRFRDYTRYELGQALREVLASLKVYRTFVRPPNVVSSDDVRYVEEAVALATERRRDLEPELFDFLRDLLLLAVPPPGPEEDSPPEVELAVRAQQLSGPVMAKGVEDTASYNYNRFVALNEVGGDPSRFGLAVEEFHSVCDQAQRARPAGMLATSTHDTKRSEDVRARLVLLSEIPREFAAAVRGWMKHNDELRTDGGLIDRNTEYLLYQSLVGAWPISTERAVAYMLKASKEAKAATSWLAPNSEYDAALQGFVETILADRAFRDSLEEFVQPLVLPGRINSLAQTLLKLTAPGVPDSYQGTELWDLSLVDPDNRRPVDYELRRRLLSELPGMPVEEVMKRMEEGLPKLLLVSRTLRLRRRRPEAFGEGATYAPIAPSGSKAEHVVAFARSGQVLTVVPRLVIGLGDDWADTRLILPAGEWANVLSGDKVPGGKQPLSGLLARFPVAVLEKTGA